MGEEHALTLGAVVARAQVVLGGVAVDLVVDEEVDLVVSPTRQSDRGLTDALTHIAPTDLSPSPQRW